MNPPRTLEEARALYVEQVLELERANSPGERQRRERQRIADARRAALRIVDGGRHGTA